MVSGRDEKCIDMELKGGIIDKLLSTSCYRLRFDAAYRID